MKLEYINFLTQNPFNVNAINRLLKLTFPLYIIHKSYANNMIFDKYRYENIILSDDKLDLPNIFNIYNERKCNKIIGIFPKFLIEKKYNSHEYNINNTENGLILLNEINYTVNSCEYEYLNLLQDIFSNNTGFRDTRNSKTLSIFGNQIEFNLNNGFPLLTTKKMFWKGIINELLFILGGFTDAKILSNKGIHIWNSNTNKEFLQSRNLNYMEGDMGPMYGYILRHQGTSYEGCDKDYSNKGYDQLKNIIDLLINDPYNRRILMTTFDPSQLDKSVLAPCHGIVIQFYVQDINNTKTLSCKMYQRSADVFLGLPFNIASYATLVHILCEITGYSLGKLIITLGDVHIYKDHIDQCIEQLFRVPYKFPSLNILKKYNNHQDPIEYIESLKEIDFEIVNYTCHSLIKGNMIA